MNYFVRRVFIINRNTKAALELKEMLLLGDIENNAKYYDWEVNNKQSAYIDQLLIKFGAKLKEKVLLTLGE